MPDPKNALDNVLRAYLVYTDRTGREIRAVVEQVKEAQAQEAEKEKPIESIPLGSSV